MADRQTDRNMADRQTYRNMADRQTDRNMAERQTKLWTGMKYVYFLASNDHSRLG